MLRIKGFGNSSTNLDLGKPPEVIFLSHNLREVFEISRIPHPRDVRLSNIASKFIAGEDGDETLFSSKLLGGIRCRLAECNTKLEQAKQEQEKQIQMWSRLSDEIAPYYEEVRKNYHVKSGHKGDMRLCKGCKTPEADLLVDLALRKTMPKQYETAINAWRAVVSKGRELRAIMDEINDFEKLFKEGSILLRLEKEIISLRQECAKLQEKVDAYPDAARAAEKELPELDRMLLKCDSYSELRQKYSEVKKQFDHAQNKYEKLERCGKATNREEVEGLEKEVKKIENELTTLERELQTMRPSFAGLTPSEIILILEKEWNNAAQLIQNYDELRSSDMKKLENLIKRAIDCEKKFEKEKNELLAKLRAQGLDLGS